MNLNETYKDFKKRKNINEGRDDTRWGSIKDPKKILKYIKDQYRELIGIKGHWMAKSIDNFYPLIKSIAELSIEMEGTGVEEIDVLLRISIEGEKEFTVSTIASTATITLSQDNSNLSFEIDGKKYKGYSNFKKDLDKIF